MDIFSASKYRFDTILNPFFAAFSVLYNYSMNISVVFILFTLFYQFCIKYLVIHFYRLNISKYDALYQFIGNRVKTSDT